MRAVGYRSGHCTGGVMEPSFWHERWSQGQIGFHQDRVHPDLQSHAPRFLSGGLHRVLVPLCGKSWDLDWLAKQGHEVTGVELSELAVQQFHAEHGRTPTVSTEGPYTAYRSEGLTVLVGDVFELSGTFDRVWDRASMVALPPPLRERYVATMKRVASGGQLMLSTFTYDTAIMSGPPFSIPVSEVQASYPQLELLALDDTVGPQFAARGHTTFEQRLWLASL